MSDIPEKVRLTKAQRELLQACARGDQEVRHRNFAVRALRSMGYVEFDGQAGYGLWWLTITPAGRAALHQEQDDA